MISSHKQSQSEVISEICRLLKIDVFFYYFYVISKVRYWQSKTVK